MDITLDEKIQMLNDLKVKHFVSDGRLFAEAENLDNSTDDLTDLTFEAFEDWLKYDLRDRTVINC